MATHCSMLAWRIPMSRGAWQAAVHGVARVGHNLPAKPTNQFVDTNYMANFFEGMGN